MCPFLHYYLSGVWIYIGDLHSAPLTPRALILLGLLWQTDPKKSSSWLRTTPQMTSMQRHHYPASMLCVCVYTVLTTHLLDKSSWQRLYTTGDLSEEMVWLDCGGPRCIHLHINEEINQAWDGAALVLGYLFTVVISSTVMLLKCWLKATIYHYHLMSALQIWQRYSLKRLFEKWLCTVQDKFKEQIVHCEY